MFVLSLGPLEGGQRRPTGERESKSILLAIHHHDRRPQRGAPRVPKCTHVAYVINACSPSEDNLHGNSNANACCLIRWRDIGAPRQSCRCFATWMASLTRQMCQAMSVRMSTKQSQRSLSVRSFMILVRDFTEVLSGIILNAFGKVWQAGLFFAYIWLSQGRF